MSERKPNAYLYEIRYGGNDEWVERASVISPLEDGLAYSGEIGIRNIRRLYVEENNE